MDQKLADYLTEKGWRYREVEGGRQVRLDEECPFCGKRKHLFFSSATTQWDCKRCGEKGNLLTMRRRLGDLKLEVQSSVSIWYRGAPDKKTPLEGGRPNPGAEIRYHKRIASGEAVEALEYLHARGFTDETIKRFRLGVAARNGTEYITIPHYYEGECVGIKMRTIPPDEKRFVRWPDCPSVLFNGDCLADLKDQAPRDRVVLLCEGETDAIALTQLGYRYAVASTTGAGKTDWPAHWLEPLDAATTILVCYDSDEAGEAGAEKAARVLGKYRTRRVRLPLKDAATMVEAGFGKEEIDKAIAKAENYDDSAVCEMSSAVEGLRDMIRNDSPKGASTGWVTLDVVLGGIRPGELTVITGDTGSGKSTWGTALARHQALFGQPVLIAPFEQSTSDILGKLVSMDAKRPVYSFTEEDLERCLETTLKLPILFLDKRGPTPFGDIKDAIYVAVHRHGVRFVLLDHLHFFLDCKSDNERQMIGSVMRSLKVMAEDLGIHIALVVHPAKLGRDYRGRIRKVVLDDLKGSSEIKQTCDNGIRVFRDRAEEVGSRSDTTEITVLKCRSPAGGEGQVWFDFAPGSELFDEQASTLSGKQQGVRFVSPEEGEKWENYSKPN